MLDRLAGRLRVPEVVLAGGEAQYADLITRGVPGRPLSALIAEGLPVVEWFLAAVHDVQAVSIADCPFEATVPQRLRELEYLLAQGLCAEDAGLRAWPGLHTPQEGPRPLAATAPVAEPVFSHGDFGDSDIFVDVAREQVYYIDFGRGGIADRWLDIAFVCRNLREECTPTAAAQFLAAPPWADAADKRRYFELLDELF